MLQATEIKSFRKPEKMAPIDISSSIKSNMRAALNTLRNYGFDITPEYQEDIKSVYGLNGYAMDAAPTAPLTTPSITTPVQFLQAWLPGNVLIATAPRKADEIIGIATIGQWEDQEVVQGLLGNSGTAEPYADNANIPLANWNLNFEKRTVVRFEQGFVVSQLEAARAARVRVSDSEEKRRGVIKALEIVRNAVAFFGYNGGVNQTYGILNDPNLLPYVPLPSGVNWDAATFNQIVGDIRFLAATLQGQSQGLIDPQTDALTLVVDVTSAQYLHVQNDLSSVTAIQYIKENYPKMRVVVCPEFTAAQGGLNAVYLFADEVKETGTDDDRTWIQPVPTVFRTLGVEKRAKSYVEDYSNATAGALCKRPFAVVRATMAA